jgi:hypothetical protein
VVEGREITNKFEEVYLSEGGVGILGFCGFQGRIEDGSRKGKGYFGLAQHLSVLLM